MACVNLLPNTAPGVGTFPLVCSLFIVLQHIMSSKGVAIAVFVPNVVVLGQYKQEHRLWYSLPPLEVMANLRTYFPLRIDWSLILLYERNNSFAPFWSWVLELVSVALSGESLYYEPLACLVCEIKALQLQKQQEIVWTRVLVCIRTYKQQEAIPIGSGGLWCTYV